MINTKNVISSLPLLADALGRKYGIKVHIGGERAYTNGNEIHLPSLPLDADEIALNLARGYLDHESAHLRITDFTLLKDALLSPFEKHIWNIIEDFLVERKLGSIYPGCKYNFNWLSRHLFMASHDKDVSIEDANYVQHILNWLLYALRSIEVPELNDEKIRIENCVEAHFPDLLPMLKPVVEEIPVKCADTASAIDYAKQIVAIIGQYALERASGELPSGNSDSDKKSDTESKPESNVSNNLTDKEFKSHKQEEMRESGHNSKSAWKNEHEDKIQILKDALIDTSALKSLAISDMVENLLQHEAEKSGNKLSVSTVVPSCATPLPAKAILEIRQQTMGLRTRLKGLLQASVLTANRIGRTGKIEPSRIARLSVNDTKIFIKNGRKQGYNTVVHILLDASGSMSGNSIQLACQACYGVVLALNNTPGIAVMVSAFPGGTKFEDEGQIEAWLTVAPILKYGERLHDRFLVPARGGTPLAETLWWTFQQMQSLKEERKIVLILSDGEPNSYDEAVNAIQIIRNSGFEIYGIGIGTAVMENLMSGKYSRSIYNLKELAAAILDMLKGSLFDCKRSVK